MPTSEPGFAPLRIFQVALVAAFALLGLLPLPEAVATALEQGFPAWRNLGLVRAALVLAAVLVGGVAVALGASRARRGPELFLHLLATVLAVHVAVVLVLIWKYAAGWIPASWTGEVIYLYSVQPESLWELYDAAGLDTPPFRTPMYPPGYFALLRGLVALLGESPFVPRLLTLVALLAIVLLLALPARARRGWWPLLTPALFLAIFPQVTWSGAPTKPEYAACALSLAGFAVYLLRGLPGRGRWIPASAALFAAGLLVKYSVIAAFAATGLHLLARRRIAECARFVLATAAGFGLVYALLWPATDGGVALFSVVANVVRPDFSKLHALGVLGFLSSGFVVLSMTAALLALLGERRVASREGVVSLAYVLALAWFVLSVGRPGSSANYVLEGALLGSLLLGLTLEGAFRRGEGAAALLAALLAVYAAGSLPSQLALLARSYGEEADQPRVRAELEALETRDGEFVFSDVYYSFDVVSAGHRPLVVDSFMYTLMSDNGRIDPAPLLRVLRDGKVPYLVLSNTLAGHAGLPYGYRAIPPAVTTYLRDHYRCRQKMKRWDGRLLLICERGPSSGVRGR